MTAPTPEREKAPMPLPTETPQAETMEARERTLRRLIAERHQFHARAFQDEIAPYIKELTDIELCKPPNPITLDDGRVMRYVGPLPVWTPNGLTMPERKP